MPRSNLLRPTFRLKLLIALIGTIAPLLLVTVLVVRSEANRQVDAIVESTAERAGDAFARIERIRQRQLEQLGIRLAQSNRVAAALQQALEGDTPFLIDQTGYDLQLAGVEGALAAFTTLGGEPVAALVDLRPLPDPAAAISASAVDRVLAGDTAVYGYHLINGRLFSIHPVVLFMVDQPVGVLLLGFAIDHETAATLAGALHADVCFETAGRCVAYSTVQATRAERVARIAHPLMGAGETGTQIVLHIPLDEVVRPFEAIQRAIVMIGVAMLLLATIIALVLSRGLAEPIRALVAATVRVARGEYDTRVQVQSRDEIGMLANAFNDMTHGLMLKEKYRGVLDKVVSRDVADEMLKGEITLGGEAREVTTLFADLRGFTALSEGMDPHDIVELLNEVMETAESAVVAEGGVVDKYVGDEIMALFGAPVSYGDDALRAVRAAVRMQQEIALISGRREQNGKSAIAFGIGINTGVVVAGNMGSARRLNYTVLGAPVNLAARLCSEAARGQILLSETTLERARERVHASSLGARDIKGFSKPVEIFELVALEEDAVPATTTRGAALGLIAALLCAPVASAQQLWTLGPLQIDPSARVAVLGFVPGDDPAWLISETSPFVAGNASAFFDLFAGKRVYGFVELRADRGEVPGNEDFDLRVQQAFARLTPFEKIDVSLQVGKFVSPFGGYPQRHHSTADPLIRPPLSYDYRTVVSTTQLPATADAFLGWKDRGEQFRRVGAPPVWAAPYPLGAMVIGGFGKLHYRVSALNSAPASEPDVWNDWPADRNALSLAAHMAVQASPELRLGASFNQGPYISRLISSPSHGDLSVNHQRLVGFEATFARGLVELRAELIHDTWEVPAAGDAIDVSYYLEPKVKIAAGLFVAGRYSAIQFNEIATESGAKAPWDYDTRRLQLGMGYRLSQAFDVRGELMINGTDGPADPRDNLLALQASWFFDF